MFRIYTLTDPRDGKIFYVGQTAQELNVRLQNHIHDRLIGFAARQIKISDIVKDGFKPVINEIDDAVNDDQKTTESAIERGP